MEELKQYLLIFWNLLWTISLIQWIIWTIIFFIWWWIIYFIRYIKSQYRFGRNLRRNIYFLKTSNIKDLQNEKDLLSNIKLFKIEQDIKDISNNINKIDNLKSNAVYIIGYDENYDKFSNVIEYARDHKNPIIIFAKQSEIKKSDHWDIFNSYIYCDVANTPNRLSIILLNILKIL